MVSPSLTLLRTQTDERLIALARAGHERAFEAIVERYRRPLLRHARRLVSEARAEEAVQQALVAAWTALQRGDDVRHLSGWLHRIVHNAALNALRGERDDYAELREWVEATGAPEDELERRELLRETLANLRALPERQREALLRVAVDGVSADEVGRALGLTEGAVRQLLYRARTALRAAATALTPMPVASWLARAEPLTARIAEAAGAGSAGLGTVLAKTGVVVVAAGGAAAGPAVLDDVTRHEPTPRPGGASRPAAARLRHPSRSRTCKRSRRSCERRRDPATAVGARADRGPADRARADRARAGRGRAPADRDRAAPARAAPARAAPARAAPAPAAPAQAAPAQADPDEVERLRHQRLRHQRLRHQRLRHERVGHQRIGRERLEHGRRRRQRVGDEWLWDERLEHGRRRRQRLGDERLWDERLEHGRRRRQRVGDERVRHERVGHERIGDKRVGDEIGSAAVGCPPARAARGRGVVEHDLEPGVSCTFGRAPPRSRTKLLVGGRFVKLAAAGCAKLHETHATSLPAQLSRGSGTSGSED